MRKLKVGDIVVHDFSKYRGKILDIRDNSEGYDYLIEWLGHSNEYKTDWYKREVLETDTTPTSLEDIIADIQTYAIRFSRNELRGDELTPTEALTAITQWAVSKAPEQHWNTDVPADRLNPQEDGEVMGWNSAIDQFKTNLTQAEGRE
jgi:hypothetical protein